MTSLVTVPVIKPFMHEGTAFQVGDTVTVRPIVAAALAQAKCVSLTVGYKTAAVKAETAHTHRRRRSAYRRRDLVAE